MDSTCVQRVGKSTVVTLLDISVGTDQTKLVFQLETGQVLSEGGQEVSATVYEPQRLVVSGSVLLAIYELIEQYLPQLKRAEQSGDMRRKAEMQARLPPQSVK